MNIIYFHKKFILIGVFTLFFLIIFPSNSSSIMVGLSTEMLARNSDIVVEGIVDDTISEWSKNSKNIITRANIIVLKVIKGDMPDNMLTVEYEGGSIGGLELRVSDGVRFSTGERVIIFLKKVKSKKNGKAFKIVGKSQGKYVISNNGIAKKQGYSIYKGGEVIDNNLPVEELMEKIRRAD